ncbi:MAG: hypothetical protein MMC23_004719 [Stictis urceolatum]|nr:hypothetical protein [Stictis urceolata]
MPGLIAMTSVFIVVGIEMFFATRGAGHMHGSEYDTLPAEQSVHLTNGHAASDKARIRRFSQGPTRGSGNSDALHTNSHSGGEAGYGQVPNHSMALISPDMDDDDPLSPRSSISDDDGPAMLPPTSPATPSRGHYRSHSSRLSAAFLRRPTQEIPSDPLAAQALEKKLLLQCLLLEAGILFHSVFIGIAVSVSVGPPFIVLLIAISFHQTFEGLALGSRIAAIPTLAPTSPKPWLMALAYGTTTPIGQAIGLGVHGLYDPQGQMGLLMVGTMNAVSSGLLLFAGLVELLAEDFLSDHSYASLTGRRRKEACGAVVAGAFLMALVGAWA